MTACDLSRLLEARHADGVFVPECKMGMAGSRTLDGWALLPTWSPLTTIGYEIKVSRSDWLRDGKVEQYLKVCHLFFLVAPKAVVQRAELPEGVGLLEPIGSGTGQRLVMRQKPQRREPDPAALVKLMTHVLMWRKGLPIGQTREQRASIWRKWIDEQESFERIGRSVSSRMGAMLREAITARATAERQAESLSHAADVLRELGIQRGYDRWSIKRMVESAVGEDARTVSLEIDGLIKRLVEMRIRLDAVSKQVAV